MKSLKYIFMAVAVSMSFASCMDGDDGLFNDDWKAIETSEAPYGNNSLTEEGVTTIAKLKAYPAYAKAISDNKYEQITYDIKIKGRVVGNDIAGNIYKEVYIQDATGAIKIGVNKAGLSGYMAIGQEILVDLKGLYIGGYGGFGQIGAPYNGGIGRMAESIWMNHFKLIGSPDQSQVKPVEFTANSANDNTMQGKLVVLKNVTFKNADGTQTFITGKRESATSNYYHQEIDGFPSNVIVRTSTYADFGASTLPFDKEAGKKVAKDIIGVASKFGDTWQIMIRQTSDIADAGSVEVAEEEAPVPAEEPTYTGKGTLESPYTVEDVIAFINTLEAGVESTEDIYIKGKVASVKEQFGTQYGNATFFISEDGTENTTQFQVFRVLYLGNKKYTEGTLLAAGDEVVICGKVVNYKGNTPETVQGKAFLYSLNGKTE